MRGLVKMNVKGQLGMLSEVFLLILILSIFALFWNFYTRNNFLVGILRVQDSGAVHTCSKLLFPLISNEYVKSTNSEGLVTIEVFRDFLNMDELVAYPTPEYLLAKIKDYYGGTGVRVDLEVYNGTEWLSLEAEGETRFFELLLGDIQPTGKCVLPIYSLISDYPGQVNMSVII